MDLEQTGLEAEVTSAGRIQAFLISDIRGYSTFTAQPRSGGGSPPGLYVHRPQP